MKILQNRKALISAAIILVIALITSVVVTPADSSLSGWVIFLMVSSSMLFMGDDSCIAGQKE